MNSQIRFYKSNDYEKVINLWLNAGLKLSLSDTQEELKKFAKFSRNAFFVMELPAEQTIIGSVIASFDGRRGYIHHLAIEPVHQNKGLGTELMKFAEDHFNEMNVVKIHLMIEKTNQHVVEYYKRIGWHTREDLILMSKNLRTEDYSILNKTPTDGYIKK